MVATHAGRLEVITGPMFSGKSEELIRRLRRAAIARLRVRCFGPELDQRYGGKAIASHNAQRLEAVMIADVAALAAELANTQVDVVGIDEAQFFAPELVPLVMRLVQSGVRVIIAGLDMTFAAEPFGPMPTLMAVADEVLKLSAVCMTCGAPAVHSQRLVGGDATVLVGAAEAYEARCRLHFSPEGAPSH